MKLGRKTGRELIYNENGERVALVLDFWQWAYSNIISNVSRGHFAEYLVASALGASSDTRVEWEKYDIQTHSGISVEVKASGYVQAWHQKNKSRISFSIRQTKAFDAASNTYDGESKRQAEVYVFCVHNYKNKYEGINPLDMKQWDFYILPTKILDSECQGQKTISLGKVIALGAIKCSYSELSAQVEKAAHGIVI